MLVFIVGTDAIIAELYFISGSLNIDVNRCIVIQNEKRIWFAFSVKNFSPSQPSGSDFSFFVIVSLQFCWS